MTRNAQIRAARFHADMTADELAQAIGKTRNTVSRWENGTTSPTLEDLRNIARVTGVSVAYLVQGAA